MERKEYLSKPFVENVTYEITYEKVYINAEHERCSTTFVNISKPSEGVPLPEIKALIKEVRTLARQSSGKYVVNNLSKVKEYLVENYIEYSSTKDKEKELFKNVYLLALQVQKDGLHIGTVDDEILNEMFAVKNEKEKLYYRNTILSTYYDKIGRLQEAKADILRNDKDIVKSTRSF